jgi:prolyl-tRNA editing enzyme YbaK/EbsC (Cys-tRNA(Pro) deacylase)
MLSSKRARQFQAMLDERGLHLRVVELPDSARTAADAARALGCEQAQIVKSLVFRNTVTGEAVLVLASGTNRVDETTVAELVGAEIAKADATFVKETTGYSIGGVPPLGHKRALLTFVDQDLRTFPETWAAAGTPHAVFRIPGDLTAILPDHKVISVT